MFLGHEDDAVAIAPDVHSVVFENDEVRILGVRLVPNAQAASPWHPPNIFYAERSGQMKIEKPDGAMFMVDVAPGIQKENPEGVHRVENTGQTDIRGLQIELK